MTPSENIPSLYINTSYNHSIQDHSLRDHYIDKILGSCPESLVARGQARLFGVAGSNPPGSVSTSLSDSSVSVSVVRACGVITLA